MTTSYSIGTVSKITGLTQERIRSWEHRYTAVIPSRTETGRRAYSESDLTRLQLFADATDQGYSISNVVKLDNDALRELLGGHVSIEFRPDIERLIQQTIDDLTNLNMEGCDSRLAAAVINLDPWVLIYEFLAPLLHKVGKMWSENELGIVQERLLSNLIRSRVFAAVSPRQVANSNSSVLFASLSGDRHELGALSASLLSRQYGISGGFIGSDLPTIEILEVAKVFNCAALGISISTPVKENNALEKLDMIGRGLPEDTELWVGGFFSDEVEFLSDIKGCRKIANADQFRENLIRLARLKA